MHNTHQAASTNYHITLKFLTAVL